MSASGRGPISDDRDHSSRPFLKRIPGLKSVRGRINALILAGLAALLGAVFKETIVPPIVCIVQEQLNQDGCELELVGVRIEPGSEGWPTLTLRLSNEGTEREYLTNVRFEIREQWDLKWPIAFAGGHVELSREYGAERIIVDSPTHYRISIDQQIGADETDRFSVPLLTSDMANACNFECVYYVIVTVDYGTKVDTLEGGGVVFSTRPSLSPGNQTPVEQPPLPSDTDLPSAGDIVNDRSRLPPETAQQAAPPQSGGERPTETPVPSAADTLSFGVCSNDVRPTVEQIQQTVGTDNIPPDAQSSRVRELINQVQQCQVVVPGSWADLLEGGALPRNEIFKTLHLCYSKVEDRR